MRWIPSKLYLLYSTWNILTHHLGIWAARFHPICLTKCLLISRTRIPALRRTWRRSSATRSWWSLKWTISCSWRNGGIEDRLGTRPWYPAEDGTWCSVCWRWWCWWCWWSWRSASSPCVRRESAPTCQTCALRFGISMAPWSGWQCCCAAS